MTRLEIHMARGQIVSYPLESSRTVSIGRHVSNDILLDDASVSRGHCLIYVCTDSIEVEDLGSTNGVRLGGERIEGRVEIAYDEELMIGNVRCFLRAVSEDAAADETTVQPRKARQT